MRLLLTRSEPDAAAMKAALEAAGHSVVVEPLLAVTWLPDAAIDLTGVQAIVATSRNGLRGLAANPSFEAARMLPVFAVGAATGALAREMGFRPVIEGPAGALALLPVITQWAAPAEGALLHVGAERLAGDLPGMLEGAGYAVRRAIAYRMDDKTALTDATAAALEKGAIDGVILMSPRAAQTFGRLAHGWGKPHAAGAAVCFCLSRAVAAALPTRAGWRIEVAAKPVSEEMLALVATVAAQSTANVR